MPAIVTRTTNPLPFQDLEPKRFEDLIRQLAYDFKPWRRLEATGRSGGDDGFDARGLEIVDPVSESERLATGEEDEGEETSSTSTDRLWLIQCKRENSIGPAKAIAYLNEIVLVPEEPLHGIVFAAACNFSKRTRDDIDAWCRDKGVAEVYVWGRGELEDMLFQPKNDNLLFAYFGISLAIRRRAVATQLRAELAIKRRLKKSVLTSSAEILIRDPSASDYPRVEDGKLPMLWRVYAPEALSFLGLQVSVCWHYAFIDQATGEWDVADALRSMERQNPWTVSDPKKSELDEAASATWNAFEPQNRGWIKVSGYIPYKNIIAVDELGDEIFEGTHLYATFHPTHGPFDGNGLYWRLSTTSRFDGEWSPTPEKRIKKFDDSLRKAD